MIYWQTIHAETRDFIGESGYYADMVDEAISEARDTLARLAVPA